MKIKQGYPPNIEDIKRVLSPDKDSVFCYGEDIYCQDPDNLPPDVIVHEKVHARQQQNFSNPDLWWQKYLLDKQFRFEQELEAYAEQYLWLKWNGTSSSVLQEALEDLGSNLAHPQYDFKITAQEASSKIRNYAKSMV